jgi:site-specific DNA-methyltransferase (adenine-specific)
MLQKIKSLKTDTLIPYAGNSRTHSAEQVAQIAASIKEFGFNNPVLVDADGGIIAGHGRVMAAQKLGLDEVPTICLDHLTDAQRRAYVIADNKLALNAEWDEDALQAEIDRLRDEDFNLDLIGFDSEELDALINNAEETEGLTDEDAVPEAPKEPVTVKGDVWLLGRHRLMCGDSTSIDAVQKLCDGQLVDMWLTDPPYNVDMTAKNEMLQKAGKARKDSTTFGIINDKMPDDDFRAFLTNCYTAADAVMKPGAVFYIWHADLEGYNFRGAAKDMGWPIRQCLIWSKSVMAIGRQDYHWKHEPCLYGWKEGAAHLWASDRKQTTILDFNKPASSGLHPTTKPVDLFEYQMLNNTKGSDLVLDSFAGSGTTAIACEKHGRMARLMELDPKYCDVIIKRWQDFTGKEATHAETNKSFNESF